jgi:hypothetical protein
MTLSDYYNILGLIPGSTAEDIKKAYRQKARQYHPDLNPSADAKDKFISATEAYEFLIAYHDKAATDNEYSQAMEDWRKYRQFRSRRRAHVYARVSYVKFRNTNFYKTTRIFDGTTIILSLVFSIIVIVYTIFGYAYGLKHPIPGVGKPSVSAFIMLLMIGMIFFTISLIYLKAYLETSKKHKKK